jgi:hypothetical protein
LVGRHSSSFLWQKEEVNVSDQDVHTLSRRQFVFRLHLASPPVLLLTATAGSSVSNNTSSADGPS